MRQVVKVLSIFVLLLLATGCSHQMVYNLIQNNQRYECYSLPAGQQENCLDKYAMSYNEYLNARKEHGDLNFE